MAEPAVSIILPTHNRAATLPRAINSVLAQTYADFELIVVDDGSSDASTAVLAQFSDPRLRVLRKEKCEGAARARNDGIRAARAALVAFQDSDDEWLPRKLELQLALLQSCDAAVGWVGGGYRYADQTVSSPRLVAGQGYDFDLLIGAPFVTPTWLVRRDLLNELGGFDVQIPCLEDWDLIFRLAQRCRFRAVPDIVLEHHSSADSLFSNIGKRRAGLEVVLTRHQARWLEYPQQYAKWCAELGRLCGLTGERSTSRKWLARSLALDFRQPRTALLWAASLCGEPLLHRLSRSRLAPTV